MHLILALVISAAAANPYPSPPALPPPPAAVPVPSAETPTPPVATRAPCVDVQTPDETSRKVTECN